MYKVQNELQWSEKDIVNDTHKNVQTKHRFTDVSYSLGLRRGLGHAGPSICILDVQHRGHVLVHFCLCLLKSSIKETEHLQVKHSPWHWQNIAKSRKVCSYVKIQPDHVVIAIQKSPGPMAWVFVVLEAERPFENARRAPRRIRHRGRRSLLRGQWEWSYHRGYERSNKVKWFSIFFIILVLLMCCDYIYFQEKKKWYRRRWLLRRRILHDLRMREHVRGWSSRLPPGWQGWQCSSRRTGRRTPTQWARSQRAYEPCEREHLYGLHSRDEGSLPTFWQGE